MTSLPRPRTRRVRATSIGTVAVVSAGVFFSASAQISTDPTEGIADRTPRVTAFTNARIVVSAGRVVEHGSLLIRDGVVVGAGDKLAPPPGADIVDLGGKTIFPGFIDPLSDYAQPDTAVPAVQAASRREAGPSQPLPVPGARHWNRRVHPETDAAAEIKPDRKRAEMLRQLGFTSVLSTPAKGIFRGQSALLALGDSARTNEAIVKPRVAQMLAFEQSNWPSDDYPSSLMGAIALIRQTLYDARWQSERQVWQTKNPTAERFEANSSLESLAPLLAGKQTAIFITSDELDYGRALQLAREFGLKAVLIGNGHEYRRVAELKAAGVPLVLPLSFPEVPAIEDPDKALEHGLEELEHWESAPFNPALLAQAGVAFAFTAAGLKKPEEKFWPQLRKAVANGLDERVALAALTVQPANMLGVGDRLGTLEPGHLANFLIADADLFHSDKSKIYENWIDGHRYIVHSRLITDPRGVWQFSWSGMPAPLNVEITGELGELSAKAGSTVFPVAQSENELLLFPPGALLGDSQERLRLVGTLHGTQLDARVMLAGGRSLAVSGMFSQPAARKSEAAKSAIPPADLSRYPAGEFGRLGEPKQASVLVVRHAVVWTQSAQGTLDDADILVEKGVLIAIAKNIKAPDGAQEIDARGKHVAPGIIDAHSHMAVAHGVNEGSHAVTSEVRIGDVLDPTDMTIYRQLAGGVTTALLLHGSANPIGGQSQIIKLRWGSDAEGLRFRGAPDTIKFALGENVKQSNWGDAFNKRYPQSRMGVEQIDLDSFLAAQDYAAKLQQHKPADAPIRRDLRLEALAEVLQQKRFVQIHSYRQDEILMFVRLAQQFHIVPVFQHVLEGYKVADAMAQIGAGGSTFSDWWAYKMEVQDAIPFNGALMASQGVVVSFNSDSDEMGRRLNTEAAKAVKYGGLNEAQALAFVTINPAKQLHLEKRVGSLEPGKDADFVVWSGNPLSTLSFPEQTWIDGRKYFDRDEDLAERVRIESERARLIAKILPERIKALTRKEDSDKKGTDAGAPKRNGQPFDRDNLIEYASLRAPYHNDEPVNGCSDTESR